MGGETPDGSRLNRGRLDVTAKLGDHQPMKRALTLLALMLAGCGSVHMPSFPSLPSGPRPAVRPAARQDIFPVGVPAPTPGLDWFFDHSDEEGRLVYGASAGSALRFGLRCRLGESEIAVTQAVDRALHEAVIFYADRAMFLYPAAAETERTGGQLLTASVARADDGLQAFRRNGWMWVDAPGGTFTGLASQPGSTAVADFFTWCT